MYAYYVEIVDVLKIFRTCKLTGRIFFLLQNIVWKNSSPHILRKQNDISLWW